MPLKKCYCFLDSKVVLWDTTDEEVLKLDKKLKVEKIIDFQKLSPKRKREFVGIYLGLDYLGIKQALKYSEHGKPFVEKGGFISISHSFGLVALALSKRREIGVDIEKKKEIALKVKHKFIHREELKFINMKNPKLYALAIWCIKEAIYKIYGGNPSLSFLNDIRVSRFDLGVANWILCTAQVQKKNETLRVKLIDLDEFTMAFAEKITQ